MKRNTNDYMDGYFKAFEELRDVLDEYVDAVFHLEDLSNAEYAAVENFVDMLKQHIDEVVDEYVKERE